METIKIVKANENFGEFIAESSKGNVFALEYECKNDKGRLYIKGGTRKACLKVKDILFWLHFFESDQPIEIEVERQILA